MTTVDNHGVDGQVSCGIIGKGTMVQENDDNRKEVKSLAKEYFTLDEIHPSKVP